MGNDIYMGGVRFTPDFDDMGAPQEQWHELSGGSGEGKVMIALAYQPSSVSLAAFYFRSMVSSHPEDGVLMWDIPGPGTTSLRPCCLLRNKWS